MSWMICKNAIELQRKGKPTNRAKSADYDWRRKPVDLQFFRMLDGDGYIYFEGVGEGLTFAPLDDYGRDFGCVSIEYLTEGRWEEL